VQSKGYSWLTMHLARLGHKVPAAGASFAGPASAAAWRYAYDAPIGVNGMRAGEAEVWGGLGFYEDRAGAEAALSADAQDLPFADSATESWHGLLAVVAHRGYLDFSRDDGVRPVPAPLSKDPGGVLAVITSAGYVSEDESQHARIAEFSAQNEKVRAFYGSLESNILRHPFTVCDARDGMTFSIWRSDPEMLTAAYRDGTHRAMMDAHKARSMFDHSSFTRLRLLANRGTWDGFDPILEAA
jgi:hypothetical protein